MRYANGEDVKVGDKVLMPDGLTGEVVASLDSGEFNEYFPEKEWGYLNNGLLIKTEDAVIVHYGNEYDKEILSLYRRR